MYVMIFIIKILISFNHAVLEIDKNLLQDYNFIKKKLLFYRFVPRDVYLKKIKKFYNVIK